MAMTLKKKESLSQPMMAEHARLHRILRIMQLTQVQQGWDATALAKECGVTERTIYRDMKMLQQAGIPFDFEEATRSYRIRQDFYMRPVELTLEEALALVALGEEIGKSEQIPFTRAAARAVAKVRGQLPEALGRELKSMDHHMSIRVGEMADAEATEGIADVFTKVQQAQARHCCLRCRYESLGEKGFTKAFLLKPYRLHFDRRAWYVLGYHTGHEQVRWLKLGRFTSVELTDEPFDVPADFSLEKHVGNAWRMMPGGKTYEVELQFDAQFAENIADTYWHKTQKVHWQEDGSLIFRCKVDGLEEIQWWILARGEHCQVRKPRELAGRVRDLALATANRYARTSRGGKR